jgi:hypothetical protein
MQPPTAILPLFPRRLQLPIPVGVNLLLIPAAFPVALATADFGAPGGPFKPGVNSIACHLRSQSPE